jgi:plastocyanin
MVALKSLFAAAALGAVSALPRPNPQDSALGIEVAVSAPFGVPLTDSVELASQSAFEAAQAAATSTTQEAPAATTEVSNTQDGNSGQYGNSPQYGAQEWTSAPPAHVTQESTSTAHISYSTPSYGSGNSNWGGSGYDDCVNQCVASYGSPAVAYQPTATSGSSGSVGTGATHTVIVAPTQGVLRYIPFAVNASVGDTVKFMWGANNHTVTRGTALTPCNRSGDAFFASGTQGKDFVFTQVVNDTNPIYFYCATSGHCQKGMFGIINPPSSFGSSSSVGGMMQDISSSNPDVAAYASYTRNHTESNTQASRWGSNIDMSEIPEWAHQYVAENVLYTRNFLASNPETLTEDGTIDLSAASSTPLMIPTDLSIALNNAGTGAAPSGSEAAPAADSSAPAAPAGNAAETPAPAAPGNGAGSLVASRVLVGAFVVLITFFSL